MEIPKHIGFLFWNFTWKVGFSITHRHRYTEWRRSDLNGRSGVIRHCKTKTCEEFNWKINED